MECLIKQESATTKYAIYENKQNEKLKHPMISSVIYPGLTCHTRCIHKYMYIYVHPNERYPNKWNLPNYTHEPFNQLILLLI